MTLGIVLAAVLFLLLAVASYLFLMLQQTKPAPSAGLSPPSSSPPTRSETDSSQEWRAPDD